MSHIVRNPPARGGLPVAFVLVFVLALGLLGACASGTQGMNAAARTTQLKQGMSPEAVRQLLGGPGALQQAGQAQVWRYSLHANWRGWVPHYLVFEGQPPTLRQWYADEAEFQRHQAEMERQWAPVVKAIERDNAARQAPAAPGKGKAGGSLQDSAECKRARFREDKMCYCYGLC